MTILDDKIDYKCHNDKSKRQNNNYNCKNQLKMS